MSFFDFFRSRITCSCGHKNKKDARFCAKCGQPLEVKYENATCPSCGAKLSGSAKFCPKCGTKLTGVETVERSSNISKEMSECGVWQRRPDDFAQRFEIEDIKGGRFNKKVTVAQGTKAIFIQGGMYKGTLPSGVYDLTERGSLFSSNLEARATVILVDSGIFTLNFETDKLRTKDGFEVACSGRIAVELQDGLKFLENFLKSEEHASLNDIKERIAKELEFVARNTLSTCDSTEIVGNREFAQILENEFKTELNRMFNLLGFEIVSLNYLSITETGALWELHMKQQENSVEISKIKSDIEKRQVLRHAENVDRIDALLDNATVKRTEQKVNHEYRTQEQKNNQEYDFRNREYQRTQEDIDLERKRKREQQEFQDDVSEIEALRRIQKQKKSDDLDIKERDLEILRKDEEEKLRIKADNERMVMENRANAPVEVLISVLGGDSAAAKEIAKLELAKRAASLTSEQILAVQSTDPNAAEALKAKFNADAQKEFNEKMQQVYKENADRLESAADRNERILEKALDAMGKTSTAKATARGDTVFYGSDNSGFAQVPQKPVMRCPKCGASISDDDVFCPECGEKI